MPYGLTGATQACQRGLVEGLRDCKDCVDTYLNDCITFSDEMSTYATDLSSVLGKLTAARFTLCGSKCQFGISNMSHLGLEYSNAGVSQIVQKTRQL